MPSFASLFPNMSGNDEILPSYTDIPTSPGGPNALNASLSTPLGDSPQIGMSDDFANTSGWTSHLTVFADPTGSEGCFKALFVNAGGSGTQKNMFRTVKWWSSNMSTRFNAVVVEAMRAEIKQVRIVVRTNEFAFTGVPTELAATPGLRGFWNDFVSCFTVFGTQFLNDFVEHQSRASDQFPELKLRFAKNAFAKYVFLGTATSGDHIGQTLPLYQVSNVQPLSISVRAEHANMRTPLNSTTHDGRRLAGHLGVMNGSTIITMEMPSLKAPPPSNSR